MKRVGLQAEILFHITILLGAALLFGGFLLLKLTEREMLEQRLGSLVGGMRLVGEALSAPGGAPGPAERALSLMNALGESGSPESWGLFDADLAPLVSVGGEDLAEDRDALRRAQFGREVQVRVDYPSLGFPFRAAPRDVLQVTVPFGGRGGEAGVLQARFSLEEIRSRILSAYWLVLFYALLYGAVLMAMGAYLLRRNVVGPVRALTAGTARVAAGDLETELSDEGPREIAQVAGSFNRMIRALQASRRMTEEKIRELERINGDLRETRDDLIQAEKMAAVGHLAAGMAHEIGNPLAALTGYLGYLEEGASAEEKEIAGRALREAERIDRLVRDLLDYAAPETETGESVDPARVLRDTRRLLEEQGALPSVAVEELLPERLPPVAIAPRKLQQVLINLLLNARDASAKGLRLSAGERDGEVFLAVADDGEGMAEEVRRSLFDPFFTTKAPGKGRGLGLTICQRIVSEAGGRLEVRSAPGAGSAFTLWLPKAEAQ